MTTRQELGEMLISGKDMQYRHVEKTGSWEENHPKSSYFDIQLLEYRIKPTIKYYRVVEDIDGIPIIYKQTTTKFPTWDEYCSQFSGTLMMKHVHDFEIPQ